jgi:hypothetical protein
MGRLSASAITAAAAGIATAAAAGIATAAAVGDTARSAVVAPSTFTTEAMPAPAVTIAPTAPWSHAQEDAVVEVSRPVITHGRALVRRVAVVAVRTHRLNANVNVDLRVSRWRQGQAREQCCTTEENFKSAHVTPL